MTEEAHAVGRPVSVCGEMAGDPAGAMALLGIGVDTLSMSAASLLRVKWVVRSFSRKQLQDVLAEVWELENASAIRSLLQSSLESAGLGALVHAGR